MDILNPNHIIITGEVGIGKTTVCSKLIEQCNKNGIRISGILTLKTDQDHRIVEDISTGVKKELTILRSHSNETSESRFTFLEEGIRFGNSVIRNSGGEDIVLIDEIGPLEMKGMGFLAYEELLNSKPSICSILVIRNSILPIFLDKHPQPFTLFEITAANRSNIHKTIFESIRKES